MKMKQQGSTLIIVLVVLLLITIIGTIAVKSSILNLKISTNAQIDALLLESNDAALFALEDQTKVSRQLAQDGMFGYFNSADSNDELVFCYRANAKNFFSMSNASVISANGNFTKNGVPGFCKAKEYSTRRAAVQTQLYLRKNTKPTTPLTTLPIGTSVGQSGLPVISNHIAVTAISILPSFSSASDVEIQNCFKQTSIKKSDTTETVMECFKRLSIPYNLQNAEYMVGGQPKLTS